MGTTKNPLPGAGASTVLAIIVASYLMIVVDISIVITGLPRIQAELGFSAARLSWVTNAYTLTFGGLLLLGARAGDLLGRRRMFIAGLSLFTLASVAIGLSQSASWMLAARAVQGAGAAVLAPSTLALLSIHFAEGPARTRALSMYAAAAGIGATLGLVLGGLFADLLSWRAGFFINLPIGIALIAAARKHIVETLTQAGRFDVVGAATSTLGMTAFVYGLVRAAEGGWQAPSALAGLGGGTLMLAMLSASSAESAIPCCRCAFSATASARVPTVRACSSWPAPWASGSSRRSFSKGSCTCARCKPAWHFCR